MYVTKMADSMKNVNMQINLKIWMKIKFLEKKHNFPKIDSTRENLNN